tara:strand:+ start:131 stop:2536 length:2406 start_codon:yes stop_codon:yes gene_type:complete
MLKSGVNSGFPSQVVGDLEKMTGEYGLEVGQAIAREWFENSSYNKYLSANRSFHNLRLYARGEQSTQKYKDELSINGDLSYLNLDWKPVPIIPKFVDIVVNGIAERMYDVKAYSQDPHGVSKRTEYMESLLGDLQTKNLNELIEETLGITINENDKSKIPGSEQELDLHMQLTYKQSVEIAEEQAINVLLEGNRYELVKKQFYYDLTVLGIGAVKTEFNQSEGVKVEYVNPANLVYSYTDSPYFEDIYYVGEVKQIPINELVKQFPDLTHENLEEILSKGGGNNSHYYSRSEDNDDNKVSVLYFNYKTHMNEVYKMKETKTGGDKAIEKDDSFAPPEEKEGGYGALKRCIEVLFEGAMILGSDKLLKWEMASNMMRPKSDITKVKMNYAICAPRLYDGKIESLVGRITGFADMIQLTHLKLQQVMSRLTPDGIYLDADGLAEIDLGNGTNYNPQEALNMYFQTGSIIGRSLTSDGDQNPGRMPVQEIQSGNGGGKMQSLIQTYNYYLQMIRDVTGLNEARDGAMPDKYSLVGVQKLAAANSNTATRHILDAGLYITSEVCESLSLRISDIIEYSPTKEAFIQKIGAHNVAILKEMSELHLYDFGIFIELMPDEEEKQLLENNIQAAIAQQGIDLEDAIDLREIRSVKLANQLLKLRRKKKLERDQKMQQENIKAQTMANVEAQNASAQMEMQKKQSESQSMQQLEQIKAQYESERMMQETELKKQVMDHEFEIQIRLAKLQADAMKSKEDGKEDRKDERTKIQASQQSELIDQRKNDSPPKDFQTKEQPNMISDPSAMLGM